MLFPKRPPSLTRQQQLASKPIRVSEFELIPADNGGGRLRVPLQPRRLAFLFRIPKGQTKTFEFDALGKFVWDHCDGRTSVQQIARKLAREYKFSEREAQVATEAFLTTLARKGLIAAAVPKRQE